MRNLYNIIFLFVLINSGFVLNAKSSTSANNLASPTATISGTTSVCQNAASPQITFTGSGGTAPYVFTYNINGGSSQTIATTSGNSVTVSAPTATAGTFNYNLVSVHDAANPTPEQSSPGIATVTISSPPVVDFTFTNDNSCSGTPIQFNSIITTGTAPYTYAWDFGDGNTSTLQNPNHSFTNTNGNKTQSFNVTLVVTAGGCAKAITKSVSIQSPGATLNSSVESAFFNGFPIFKVCTNDISQIDFINTSTTSLTDTNYVINWGDSTPNFSATTFSTTSHTYSVGLWTLTYTVTGQNGCSITRIYKVFVGNNPAVGIGNPGNTNICISTPLTFPITGTENNPPGTIYTISFNDGSAPTTFNHPPPATITHTFLKSSCGVTSSGLQNSFSATIEASNPCDVSFGSVVPIRVSEPPVANFTLLQSKVCTNTQTCFTDSSTGGAIATSSSCTNPKIVWIISPSTGYTLNSGTLGNDNGGSTNTNTWTGGTNSICPVFSVSGTYTITMKTGNSCDIDEISKTICVETPLVPQFTLDTNLGCKTLAVTATNTTNSANSCTAPTYLWNVNYAAANCGTTSSYTYTGGTTATSSSPIFNFVNPGTYSISLTATNSCGAVTSAVQTVTVKQPPTITSINGILANYCGATTINPTATISSCAPASSTLTYAWNFAGGIPTTSNLANPGSISYATAGNYTVELIVSNECGASAMVSKSFAINDAPVLTNTPLSQTICSGSSTALVNLTSSPPGATFSWTATATAGISGFTPSGTSTIPTQTISTTNTSSGTITYAITPSLGGCPGTVTNYVITVNPAPAITTQPASSTICLGGSPTLLSFTTSGVIGTPTYQWYSNSVNNTTTGTAIPGETNATYPPPATTAGTLYYYCIITLPSGGCSNIKTNTATVTIIPNATITTQPTPTQNLCVGVTLPTPLTIAYSGGTGTASYQWYSNTSNSIIGGAIIAGATSATYSPPVFTSPGNYFYFATVSLSGNGCLPATSDVAEVIVYADPTISAQPIATQTLCQTASPLNLDVTATGGNGTFSYQWYSNSTNSNTGGTLIPGETSNSYIPPTNSVGTKYYYCIVSQNSTSGCSVSSVTAAIIVISAPTITQPASSTICVGGTPAVLSITVSGATGTPQYQWYSNNNTTGVGGILISGETSATFNPPAAVTGTFYYYCIITLPSGGCSSITSNTATVTINAGATIDTQPTATQSLCVGATIATPLSITYSGGTGTASYQWYSNTTNLNTGGTLIPSATSASYTPAVYTTSGNYYYYATLSFSGNGCGSISSNPAEIVVVSDPIVSSQPLVSQTLCQGATPTNLTVSASGGIGTYSYQWFSSVSNSNSGGVLISGETNASYTPATTNVGTTYYYCEITQTNGPGCNVTSATAKVTINLAPAFTTTLSPSTICLGQNPSPLTVVTNSDSLSPNYQWYSNANNLNSGGTLVSGETNATFNPPNSTVGTTYYYCVVTFPSITGGCSEIISSSIEIIINPNPVISNKSTIICSGNSFTITPLNSGSEIVPVGTTYTWSNPTISPAGSITGTSAQNIQQTTISQTLINTTTSPATVTYTVTPLSGVCTGVNFTIVVTVNPAISSNVTSTNSICFGANNGAIQTNITGGIPFSSGAPYLISWTGPNGFTSSASNISNLAPGSYDLSITDAGGCPIAETYTITEPNDIVITTDLEKDVTCFNAANGEIKITISGGTLNYTFAWTKDGMPYAITEDVSNLSPGIYVVTVSDVNNCGPKTATFTITEPPILAVNLVSQTNILCFGQPTGTITVTVVGGTSPYTYAWKGPNGFTSSNQNLTAIFAGAYDLIVTDNSDCTKNLSVQLTQTPEISITATTTPIICYGDNNASINIVVSGGIAPYQILWSNLGSGTFQDNLSAGDYLITVTDALNCTQTLNVNIPEPPIFTVNPVVKNISCFGAQNGSINLNFIGGIAPIKLTWSDNSFAGTTRNNLGPGQYTVTIVDSKPCTIVRTFTILEPQALILSANTTNAFDCNDANSGAINLLVSGGSAPFTYAWSNGATTEDLANIPAGNYLVTVTDANGCSKTAQYVVIRPKPISIAVTTETVFNCDTKSVSQKFTALASGGVPPFTYNWSSGTISGANNTVMETNQSGVVVLVVTDALGCKANYSLNVEVPVIGNTYFSTSSHAYTTYGSYSIQDPIQFTNLATGDYSSIVWDFGDGSVSTEENPVHSFVKEGSYVITQTVSYSFGCVYTNTVTLTVDRGYKLISPNGFTPNGDGINDTFKPAFAGLNEIQLDVYDTWGELIYSEKGPTLKGWDGKIKGTESENGNYYYKVMATTFYGTRINEKGPFTLIK